AGGDPSPPAPPPPPRLHPRPLAARRRRARTVRGLPARGIPAHDRRKQRMNTKMSSEMAEQPRVLGSLVERFDSIAAQVREVTAESGGIKGVAFLARGSSDNSALLGRYAIEQQTGLPTSLVEPSI